MKRTPLILLLLSFVLATIAGDLVTTKDSEEDSEAADHNHIEEEVKVRVHRIRSGRCRVSNRAFNRNSLFGIARKQRNQYRLARLSFIKRSRRS